MSLQPLRHFLQRNAALLDQIFDEELKSKVAELDIDRARLVCLQGSVLTVPFG
jgi:hypothetical protein